MKKQCGPYSVELGHSDKPLYPDDGWTKADIATFYEKVSHWMLPHLRDRPLTMERYPDGIGAEGFIQKAFPDYFPDWFRRARVDTSDGKQTVPLCNNQASLLYLVDQASLTQHVWLSRIDRPHHPDQMVFDLDPPDASSAKAGFAAVRRAARDCLTLFDELELATYLKTTGSRGLHLVVPLRRQDDFDQVREFARACAEVLVERFPRRYTLEQRIDKRGGRLYLDIQRNAYGQTAVAPFSLRCKAGAPVATPIARSRLDDPDLHAQSYRLDNLSHYLGQTRNPWHHMRRRARGLEQARKRLAALQR